MKNKKFLYRVATVAVVGTLLAQALHPLTAQAVKFPEEYVNHKKALKNATLHVGYMANDAFKGALNVFFETDAMTATLASPGESNLFRVNDDGKYIDGGFADIKFDRKKLTAVITLSDKARWSDGEPVTSRDVAYAYEVVTNKDSGSPYYNDDLEKIVGVKEYHAGQTDKIAGLEEVDDKHLVMHFNEMTPSIEYVGSGYLFDSAEPYHYLKDVPFDKLEQSDKLHQHPLFFGPYQVKKVVEGQSIEWVPNKYYGGPKPKLAKIVMDVVPDVQALAMMRAKKYDVLMNSSALIYNRLKKDKDMVTLGELGTDITYLGFKVGKFENGMNVMDRSLPMSDRSLRQAVAYAMNVQKVLERFGRGGLKYANTMLSPAYGSYHDKSVVPFYQDLKKANALLDKAGYKRGKDGYRTLPNGKKLVLKMLAQNDGEGGEVARSNYIQLWKKIGLNVKLYGGRALDYNEFTKVLPSNAKFDMWMDSWLLPPEPTNLPDFAYSLTSKYNYGHFATKENTRLIASLNSPRAYNEKYRVAQVHKWQQYMRKEAFVVPLAYSYNLETISKRVKGMTINDTDKRYSVWDDVALTK